MNTWILDTAVEAQVRSNEPRSSKRARSRARPENSRFLLTDDFHGRRQTGTKQLREFHSEWPVTREPGCALRLGRHKIGGWRQ